MESGAVVNGGLLEGVAILQGNKVERVYLVGGGG